MKGIKKIGEWSWNKEGKKELSEKKRVGDWNEKRRKMNEMR